MPYFLNGYSYFKLSEQKKDEAKYLDIKDALKFVFKGFKQKDNADYISNFTKECKDLHDTSLSMVNFYYKTDDVKAKFLAEYLVKIYKDTTEAYNDLVLGIKPRPDKEIIELTNKGLLNQTDANGLKQGSWKKVYSNGKTAYEVNFVNGKPVGEFKRFYQSGNIYVLLNYNESGENASAKFYSETGELISEGNYKGKNKEGLWKYYDKTILSRSEEFKGDSLWGKQIVYYPDGKVYDEKNFVNGLENGPWLKFYENGQAKLKTMVVNGKLEGAMLRYFSNGSMEVKGLYKNDLAEGDWTYYSEEGSKQVIKYKGGVPENEEKLDEENSENYKKTLDMSKRLIDPQDYKNNPEEYQNKTGNTNSGGGDGE
jgi:antitoxin component YwqK of YwqJK toxin-antitoxin module